MKDIFPSPLCPLCQSESSWFHERFHACEVCGGIFLRPELRLSPELEKAEYLTHENDVTDPRYQKFVSPIVEAVSRTYDSEHLGLDFGCGTGPVISELLSQQGYKICRYDPFFAHEPALLEKKYDYIACCEVVEHFFFPDKEFALLRNLLRPGGTLFIMTLLYEPRIDFNKWFYIKDDTHVFLYRDKTFAWIKDRFSFTQLDIGGRLISLRV